MQRCNVAHGTPSRTICLILPTVADMYCATVQRCTQISIKPFPSYLATTESAMRDHFLLSLENRKIEPFPRARKPATICIRISIALYCVCKLPEAGNMVCCDLCNDWYHYHCAGLQEQEDLVLPVLQSSPEEKKTVLTLSFV